MLTEVTLDGKTKDFNEQEMEDLINNSNQAHYHGGAAVTFISIGLTSLLYGLLECAKTKRHNKRIDDMFDDD